MKKFLILLLCVTLITSCGNAPSSTEPYIEQLITLQNESALPLDDLLAPAIVGVLSSNTNGNNIGAGVCVAPNGIIITNSHVINNSTNITLYLMNGVESTATILYEDTVLDFAIIKANTTLPYLPINLDDTLVGQEVIAVGTPISLMLKHTFTKGIVSATNRTIKINSLNGEAYMHSLIQHDASLNPGNSGGPLLNTKGEVVGINTLKISSGEGIGFAIPCKSFSSLLDKIVNNKQLSSPYLGVYGYDAEIAKFNKLTINQSGFYIEDINKNSPLYNHLSVGDVILSINNKAINNASDLRYELNKYAPNDTIEIEYYSVNSKKTHKLSLGSIQIQQT